MFFFSHKKQLHHHSKFQFLHLHSSAAATSPSLIKPKYFIFLQIINTPLFIFWIHHCFSFIKMGNSFGCSASGERLVSAARDGDLVEAKMLLEFNPSLAKYSTFGGLNSPLHFAASKGHNEVSLFYPFHVLKYMFFVWIIFINQYFGLLLCLLDCGIAAWEGSWCEFKKLLWAGIAFIFVWLVWFDFYCYSVWFD